MAAEFFYPYAYGGSEWSIYTLAKALIQKGHAVTVLTPNYGTQHETSWEKIDIVRMPFFFRLRRYKRADISPFWFTNVVWWITSFIHLLMIVKKRNIDVVHVQGKFFLPAAYFVKLLTGIPVIVTLRDYQVLCPFGFCLVPQRKYKACGFKDLILKDFPHHLNAYSSSSSLFMVVLHLIAAVRGKFASLLLKHLANRMDMRICISKKQQQILRTNGVKDPFLIYNMAFFPSVRSKGNIVNKILFIGRLTPGKGILVLLDSFEILQKHDKVKLVIIGEGFLSKKIKKWIAAKRLEDSIQILGQKNYRSTLEMISKAKMVVVPSIWEEPFGRVALEALSVGTPVIASDRGALPEIVMHQKTGYITTPSRDQLSKAIEKGLKNHQELRVSIRRRRHDLKQQFYKIPLMQHIDLYTKLIEKEHS